MEGSLLPGPSRRARVRLRQTTGRTAGPIVRTTAGATAGRTTCRTAGPATGGTAAPAAGRATRPIAPPTIGLTAAWAARATAGPAIGQTVSPTVGGTAGRADRRTTGRTTGRTAGPAIGRTTGGTACPVTPGPDRCTYVRAGTRLPRKPERPVDNVACGIAEHPAPPPRACGLLPAFRPRNSAPATGRPSSNPKEERVLGDAPR
jgi:hypothetical protein